MCPKVVERYPGCGCPYYTDSDQRDYAYGRSYRNAMTKNSRTGDAYGRSYGYAVTKDLRVGDAYGRSYNKVMSEDLRVDNACPAHGFSNDYQTGRFRRRKGHSIDNWSSQGGGGFFIPSFQTTSNTTTSTSDSAARNYFVTTSGLADTSKQLPDWPAEENGPNHPQRDINECPRESDWVSGGGVEHGSVNAAELQEQQAQQLEIHGGKFTFNAANSRNESHPAKESLHDRFGQATAPPAHIEQDTSESSGRQENAHSATERRPDLESLNFHTRQQPATESDPSFCPNSIQLRQLSSEEPLASNHLRSSSTHRIVNRTQFRHLRFTLRPCYILIILGAITVFGSLGPALWRSTARDDIEGGFSLGQYILGVGIFVVGSMVAIHSRTCTCWQ